MNNNDGPLDNSDTTYRETVSRAATATEGLLASLDDLSHDLDRLRNIIQQWHGHHPDTIAVLQQVEQAEQQRQAIADLVQTMNPDNDRHAVAQENNQNRRAYAIDDLAPGQNRPDVNQNRRLTAWDDLALNNTQHEYMLAEDEFGIGAENRHIDDFVVDQLRRQEIYEVNEHLHNDFFGEYEPDSDDEHENDGPLHPDIHHRDGPPGLQPIVPAQDEAEPGFLDDIGKQNCRSCWVDLSKQQDMQAIRLGCSHMWCKKCLNACARAALRNRQNWPAKCCFRAGIDLFAVRDHLDEDVQERLDLIGKEFEDDDPTYCFDPKCGGYISKPPTPEEQKPSQWTTCQKCQKETCVKCKAAKGMHLLPGHCPDLLAPEDKALMVQEGWKQCPNPRCRKIIERSAGCEHIKCECGTHFCYRCGRHLGSRSRIPIAEPPCKCDHNMPWGNPPLDGAVLDRLLYGDRGQPFHPPVPGNGGWGTPRPDT